MKKFIAKEFLWCLGSLVAALPLSLLFMALMDLVSGERYFSEKEKLLIVELFVFIYIANFTGIYLIRLVISAIKILARK